MSEEPTRSQNSRLFELKDLDFVVAISESGSLRRAAQSLGVEPSAISRRLRTLEDKLGTSLFERHQGGAKPTNAGRVFLQDVLGILARMDEAVRTVAGAGRAGNGRVAIGIASSLSSRVLNRVLSAFRSDHPEISLDIFEGSYHEHVASLNARSCDIAFVPGTPQSAAFESDMLWSDPLFVALPSEDKRAQKSSLPWSAIADDAFIVSGDPSGPEVHAFIVRRLSGSGVHPTVSRFRVGREALMTMVGLGFGTSLLCASQIPAVYENVSFVAIEGETVPCSAMWSATNDNPALQRFLSLARRLSRDERQLASSSQTPDLTP